MSSITKGKHIVAEVNGIRCTVVETAVNESRMQFLKELLETNGYKVITEAKPGENGGQQYTVGVTDILFHPVIAIYERRLKTKEGKIVSPSYWNQNTTLCDSRYWMVRKRISR